jgi:hypothetical protein
LFRSALFFPGWKKARPRVLKCLKVKNICPNFFLIQAQFLFFVLASMLDSEYSNETEPVSQKNTTSRIQVSTQSWAPTLATGGGDSDNAEAGQVCKGLVVHELASGATWGASIAGLS